MSILKIPFNYQSAEAAAAAGSLVVLVFFADTLGPPASELFAAWDCSQQ